MEHLEKLILLKQKAAYQETPPGTGEPAFKAHARKKQSLFRQMVLGIPYDPKHKFGKYGAFLMEPFASLGYNFCDVYRSYILNGIKERYAKMNVVLHEESYERVFVAEYQQYKKIKVQKYGYGKTGYKSCFLRK